MLMTFWNYVAPPLNAADARKEGTRMPAKPGSACAIAFASAADMKAYGDALETRGFLVPGVTDSHIMNGEGDGGAFVLPLLPHSRGEQTSREAFVEICRQLPDLRAMFVEADLRSAQVGDPDAPHTLGVSPYDAARTLSRGMMAGL